ncbi:hypothetical protein FQN55_003914 [Onygenales sp. PD_40]|nr:hypothetical protein FQN55_003914 [Onygenales sp. PD_40]
MRLGDVVVGQPTPTSPAVIFYDSGKHLPNGMFERTGHLNSPPNRVLTALSAAKIYPQDMLKYLSRLTEGVPGMKFSFRDPGADQDRLFDASSTHRYQNDPACKLCDRTQIWTREEQQNRHPKIHYGTIATGVGLVRDPGLRDTQGYRLDALCFEMEAAGLAETLPCLVIRGISDYADSHKNDIWHGYASATAASFAKMLLMQISPIQNSTMQIPWTASAEHGDESWADEFLVDLKSSPYEEHKNVNPDRMEGTCEWVLKDKKYTAWLHSKQDNLLWISADPGCGKSVLSKSLVDNELRDTGQHTVCYFFFKDNREQDNLCTALCALLHQLFRKQRHLLKHAREPYRANGKAIPKEVYELWRILMAAARDSNAGSVTCVLDALDECREKDRHILIQLLRGFYGDSQRAQERGFQWKMLVTSRPYQNIEVGFTSSPVLRLQGEQKNSEIGGEIETVIRRDADELAAIHRLSTAERNYILLKIHSISNRTYLWWRLVLIELKSCDRGQKIEIMSLPATVEQAYEGFLNQIPQDKREKAKTLLSIIVGARRPLKSREMDVAFRLALGDSSRTMEDLKKGKMDMKLYARDLLRLFVYVDEKSETIHLIHQTAKEFLVSNSDLDLSGSGWKHSLTERSVELILALLCVQYVLLEDFVVNRGEHYHENKYPFFHYATIYWPSHYRALHAFDKKAMFPLVLRELYNDEGENRYGRFKTITNEVRKIPDSRNPRSIHVAAFHGHDDILKWLLEVKRIDVNETTTIVYGSPTPLDLAGRRGHESTAQLLREKGGKTAAEFRNLRYGV